MENKNLFGGLLALLVIALSVYLLYASKAPRQVKNVDRGVGYSAEVIDQSRNRMSLYDGGMSPIRKWNTIALETIASENVSPPEAARFLAMLHITMFEVLNLEEKRYEPWDERLAQVLTPQKKSHHNTDAFVDGAGAAIFERFFPRLQGLSENELAHYEAADTYDLTRGYNAAQHIYLLRAYDGHFEDIDYEAPVYVPGQWRPTPPYFEDPLVPHWASMTTFHIDREAFDIPAPLALDSVQYAQEHGEVQDLGGRDSAIRSEEQSLIAQFWAGGKGTYTPPGQWNYIAGKAIETKDVDMSLIEEARLYALLNIALVDASALTWREKFEHEYWRPIDAIREADTDGNELTVQDKGWFNLIETPNFPEYPSGHSTFSGAASAVLSAYFGDETGFRVMSLDTPGYERDFERFSDAAVEAGMSRIYGGIHFMSANVEGLRLGEEIGRDVYKNAIKEL